MLSTELAKRVVKIIESPFADYFQTKKIRSLETGSYKPGEQNSRKLEKKEAAAFW